ncbi:MAG TPA: hypothetical protein VHU18_06095 [Rhizomicrobium sp.]|nr:hypothetical protein [Rhizomicrobium sp.]
MEAKIKHLEFVQNAIARMAGNSFLLKGWAITITGALIALSFKEIDTRYVLVSGVALLFFWLLDAYYLSRERRFVNLYEHVRKQNERDVEFSMDARGFSKRSHWLRCAVSTTLLLFYGGLLFVHLLAFYDVYK